METITISVVLRFSIKQFPISVSELFLVIRDICRQISKRIAVAVIQHCEHRAAKVLQRQGWERHGYQTRTLTGVLGKIRLRLLRTKRPGQTVRYGVRECIEIPCYVQYRVDAFEGSMGLLPHLC